jgi:adenine phosphoribosyltransferase
MSDKKTKDLSSFIRSIPDFPKKGIIFRDITTLVLEGGAFKTAIELLTKKYRKVRIDKIAAIESRGFIFGSVLAYKLGAGLIPVRKKGKLPHKTVSIEYDLEYGKDTLEIHADAVKKGERILIVDDLLATGGTAAAVIKLLEKMKAKIQGTAFLVELPDLNGRKKLNKYPVTSLIKFGGH